MRAMFNVVFVSDEKIILEDLDGPMSITNDAEAVLAYAKKNYPGRRLIYRDTEGEYTEILDNPDKTWMGTSPITFVNYYTQ